MFCRALAKGCRKKAGSKIESLGRPRKPRPKGEFSSERPLDFSSVDFGGPGGSVGELSGPPEKGGAIQEASGRRMGSPPGKAQRSKILESLHHGGPASTF